MPALAKPASRPAKPATAPKPKPAVGPSHPPYFEVSIVSLRSVILYRLGSVGVGVDLILPVFRAVQMINEAISALKERTGSSSQAIAKYVEDKHGRSLPANFKKMLSVQLRGFAAKGKLVKVKASYKLSDAAKKASLKPKTKPKPKPKPKPAALKPAKGKTAAAAAKPKKSAAGTKRKVPEEKAAAKAKAKPKTVKSPASKKARKVAA
jgi:histone H1/5